MQAAKHILSIVLAGAATLAASQAYAAMSRDQAVAVFNKAQIIYAKSCTAGPNNPPPPLPATLEDETGNALTTAEELLSKTDDADLLKALIAYVGASDCSADESRAFSLGLIFHKRPDALQAAIAALPDDRRCELVRQLDWGWQNEIYGKTLDRKVKADREARLQKLKSSLPKSCTGGE